MTTVATAVVIPYLAAEGLYALVHGPQAETSLAYSLYARLRADDDTEPSRPHDPNSAMVHDVASIERRIDAMRAHGIGVGNSPFSALKTDEAAVNTELDGCIVQKPGIRKTMSFLRSNLFNPFDQMTYFHDADVRLPDDLAAFFERYGFRDVVLTTNEHGERLTLPALERPDKVLIAGDSVANGVLIDDAETLASDLQRRDPERQYVNLGIARAAATDTVCALERAAARYRGQIRGLVYVHCENDFSTLERYGNPDDLVAWLEGFVAREGVEEVTLVYAPYVYNTVPEVTRIRGHSHYRFPTYSEEKARLLELARAAGFRVIDFADVTRAEQRAVGSQLAALALYVDHAHWSPLGVDRVADRIRPVQPVVGSR